MVELTQTEFLIFAMHCLDDLYDDLLPTEKMSNQDKILHDNMQRLRDDNEPFFSEMAKVIMNDTDVQSFFSLDEKRVILNHRDEEGNSIFEKYKKSHLRQDLVDIMYLTVPQIRAQKLAKIS